MKIGDSYQAEQPQLGRNPLLEDPLLEAPSTRCERIRKACSRACNNLCCCCCYLWECIKDRRITTPTRSANNTLTHPIGLVAQARLQGPQPVQGPPPV